MRGGRISKFFGLFVTLICWTLPVVVCAAESDPAATAKVKKGYIDNNFAISSDGKNVAYLHVLSDKRANLVIGRLSSKGFVKSAGENIAGHTVMPASMEFAPDGKHVFVKWKEASSGSDVDFSGGIFSLSGKLKKKLGPFEDARFRKEGASYSLVTYRQTSGRGMVSHQITVYSYPQLIIKGTHRMVTDQARRLKNPNMEILYFRDSYLKAVGKIAGKYDRKNDIRLPDKEALYDIVKKKVISEKPIKKAVAWEKVRLFRQNNPPFEPIFYLEVAADGRKLNLMRKDNVQVPITLETKLERYRRESLNQQIIGKEKALVGLTVDPQNPIILKQRKSEPEKLHLFFVQDWKNPSTKNVLKLDSDKHVIKWKYGKGFVAVMKLHRRWQLGSKKIKFYQLKLP